MRAYDASELVTVPEWCGHDGPADSDVPTLSALAEVASAMQEQTLAISDTPPEPVSPSPIIHEAQREHYLDTLRATLTRHDNRQWLVNKTLPATTYDALGAPCKFGPNRNGGITEIGGAPTGAKIQPVTVEWLNRFAVYGSPSTPGGRFTRADRDALLEPLQPSNRITLATRAVDLPRVKLTANVNSGEGSQAPIVPRTFADLAGSVAMPSQFTRELIQQGRTLELYEFRVYDCQRFGAAFYNYSAIGIEAEAIASGTVLPWPSRAAFRAGIVSRVAIVTIPDSTTIFSLGGANEPSSRQIDARRYTVADTGASYYTVALSNLSRYTSTPASTLNATGMARAEWYTPTGAQTDFALCYLPVTGVRTLVAWDHPAEPPTLERDVSLLPDGITTPEHARMINDMNFGRAANFLINGDPTAPNGYAIGKSTSSFNVTLPFYIVATFDFNHPQLRNPQ